MASLSWSDNHADRLWARDAVVDGISAALSVSRFEITTNSTAVSANEERFASAKSIRTSTIILACVNLLAALATAAVILRESYTRSRKSNATLRFRPAVLGTIRPRDRFPLILSVGIFIQSVVFAAVQSTGLQALLVLGCAGASQIMFPAAFIVPYLQLILGLATTLRALRPGPFKSQGRWSLIICLSTVAGLLILHAVITIFVRPPSLCFASLLWLLQRYATECFGLVLGIVVTAVMATAALSFKLREGAKIDLPERQAASAMVYYMGIGAISNALLLPFFYSLAFLNPRDAGPRTLRLSLVAAVAANTYGLTTGGLYLFLRSNWLSAMAGSPRETRPINSRTPTPINIPPPLRKTGSTDFLVVRDNDEEEALIESPVVPASIGNTSTYGHNHRLSSGEGIPRGQREGDIIIVDLVSNRAPPTPSSTHPPTRGFPSMQSPASLLPATAYTPYASANPRQYQEQGPNGFLAPPPPVLGPANMHWRPSSMSSSMRSSATVQIGLRFSNLDDVPPMTSSRYFQDSTKVYSISGFDENPALPLDTRRPSPLGAAAVGSDWTSQRARPSVYGQDEIFLDAKVYNPRSPARVKITSPRGVGFKQPHLPPKMAWI